MALYDAFQGRGGGGFQFETEFIIKIVVEKDPESHTRDLCEEDGPAVVVLGPQRWSPTSYCS